MWESNHLMLIVDFTGICSLMVGIFLINWSLEIVSIAKIWFRYDPCDFAADKIPCASSIFLHLSSQIDQDMHFLIVFHLGLVRFFSSPALFCVWVNRGSKRNIACLLDPSYIFLHMQILKPRDREWECLGESWWETSHGHEGIAAGHSRRLPFEINLSNLVLVKRRKKEKILKKRKERMEKEVLTLGASCWKIS